MLQSDPDERLIYLACQHIFRGPNSQVRKLKTVKGLIRQNELSLTDVLREYDVDRTSSVAKKLLESQVFDSTLKAKIRFPELFDVSPTQSAEREASEAEAAKEEANTMREISASEASKDIEIISHTEVESERTVGDDRFIPANCPDQDTDTPIAIRSLYPVYIHYRYQHQILTTIQELLKESCFEFSQRHFPYLLITKGQDYPEAVKLTEQTKILSRYSTPPFNDLKRPVNEFIILLRELRHSTIHRLRKTATSIKRLTKNAQLFLEALEDSNRSEKVERVRRELRTVIEELKRNKDLLERRLVAQLKEIEKKRSELDAQEKNAREGIIREDLQYSRDIGKLLQSVIRQVKSKDPEITKGEKTIPDIYSESLDSEEEFLDTILITPQF